MYHWNPETLANPEYGLQRSEASKFAAGQSDVGRGQYFMRNQTAPEGVTCSFSWNGAAMQQFRKDWENPNALNFGAAWFTMDLPVPAEVSYSLPSDIEGWQRFVVHCSTVFSAVYKGHDWWNVNLQLDIDVSPQLVF